MNFEFTDEQKMFVESVRKFAHAELAPGALKRAHDPRFPFDIAKRMHAQGLMGITLPEADGGVGGTLMDAIIAIEEVAAACPRSADVVANADSTLLKISSNAIEQLAKEAPEIATPFLLAVGKTLTARIRADNKRYGDAVRVSRFE